MNKRQNARSSSFNCSGLACLGLFAEVKSVYDYYYRKGLHHVHRWQRGLRGGTCEPCRGVSRVVAVGVGAGGRGDVYGRDGRQCAWDACAVGVGGVAVGACGVGTVAVAVLAGGVAASWRIVAGGVGAAGVVGGAGAAGGAFGVGGVAEGGVGDAACGGQRFRRDVGG
jgi:hypothetical protein